MTRRDYELISDALSNARPLSVLYETQWARDCRVVANALHQDNPRNFDRALFLISCGVNQP